VGPILQGRYRAGLAGLGDQNPTFNVGNIISPGLRAQASRDLRESTLELL